MSDEPVISVQNVSKAYRIWETPADRLLSPMQAGLAGLLPSGSGAAQSLKKRAARSYRDFYALRDISFEVKRGESVGIIGRNGSGKSTLLQIIAGTLQPTAGSVKVNGRIAALLELGSGFNPEFSGRENVYLYGAVLGFSRSDIDARFDAIAAFADIGDFIEQPVKIYSSGMLMRLAFSVQSAVDPELLIIDEALGVGDVFFQQKCAERLRRLLDRGVTLLFVSHDAGAVSRLCSRALWLSKGQCVMADEAQKVLRLFSAGYDDQTLAERIDAAKRTTLPPVLPASGPTVRLPESKIEHVGTRTGNGSATILGVGLYDAEGNPTHAVFHGSEIRLRFSIQAQQRIKPAFGYAIRTRLAEYLASDDSNIHKIQHGEIEAGTVVTVNFAIKLPLMHPGDYTFTVNVWDLLLDAEADKIQDVCTLRILFREKVHVQFRFEGSCTIEE